jgi:hypothetical protein
MKWITRKNVKVDRVACPWLIQRFIDPQAEFVFVNEDRLVEVANQERAIPFDAPRVRDVKLNHRGNRCTFEAILEDYRLTEPALAALALIVRSADIRGEEHVAVEGIGLRAIAQGFAYQEVPDEQRLSQQFPLYDALFAYCQRITAKAE